MPIKLDLSAEHPPNIIVRFYFCPSISHRFELDTGRCHDGLSFLWAPHVLPIRWLACFVTRRKSRGPVLYCKGPAGASHEYFCDLSASRRTFSMTPTPFLMHRFHVGPGMGLSISSFLLPRFLGVGKKKGKPSMIRCTH